MKRCSRCIFPETVPSIYFTESGVCNFCSSWKKENYLGEEEFKKIIDITKKQNAKYDCIVPISGGRDSVFILYMAKVIYGLKVLAVNYDNEFRTDQALINIYNACQILDVKFIIFRSKINIAKKITRTRIEIALNKNYRELTNAICGACTYGYKNLVYKIAIENEIPLIIWGESKNEKTSHMQKIVDSEIKKIKSNIPKDNALFKRLIFLQRLQKAELSTNECSVLSGSDPIPLLLKSKNIKEVRLFDYIEWDRKKIKETITKKLNWKKPPESVSTWRTDCKLHHFMNYCFFKMFGCSKDCFGYCNMINDKQMNRQEALNQEKEMLKKYDHGIKNLLIKDVGLSEEEAKKIMHLHSAI